MTGLLTQAGLNEVDMLKVDCEGMDYAVFQATGPEYLQRIKVLACEYHPQPDHDVVELDAILQSAGFRIQRTAEALGVLWATR